MVILQSLFLSADREIPIEPDSGSIQFPTKQPSVHVCYCRDSPQWARASSVTRFIDHTQRRTTVGTTPLDDWSARRRAFCLTIHNTHNRQTSMPPVGFEPTTPAGERPQNYALDRASTGTGKQPAILLYIVSYFTRRLLTIFLLCFFIHLQPNFPEDP